MVEDLAGVWPSTSAAYASPAVECYAAPGSVVYVAACNGVPTIVGCESSEGSVRLGGGSSPVLSVAALATWAASVEAAIGIAGGNIPLNETYSVAVSGNGRVLA